MLDLVAVRRHVILVAWACHALLLRPHCALLACPRCALLLCSCRFAIASLSHVVGVMVHVVVWWSCCLYGGGGRVVRMVVLVVLNDDDE